MAVDRREMIKRTAAATAAMGAVWTAPKVEGLSLRPDYAAAQSMTGCTPYSIATATSFPSGGLFAGTTTVQGPQGSFNLVGRAQFNVSNLAFNIARVETSNASGIANCLLNLDRIISPGTVTLGTQNLQRAVGDFFLSVQHDLGGTISIPQLPAGPTLVGRLCCD